MLLFFFFKQKTAYEMRISDWSSDVCSSDLQLGPGAILDKHEGAVVAPASIGDLEPQAVILDPIVAGLLCGIPCYREAERLVDEIGRASCRERVCQYV